MTATGIRVTPEQLQQISAQLDAGASTIEGTLRQLAGNVAPLGSDWAGVAQARFLEPWAEWQRSGQLAAVMVLVEVVPPRQVGWRASRGARTGRLGTSGSDSCSMPT
jgi:WXG100 family type VII secretion target